MSPYASSFVRFFFCIITLLAGAVVLMNGVANISTIGNGRQHHSPPVIGRTVKVELQRHSPVVKEASAKDASPVVYTANADSKKIKHYKPKAVARQRNNYGYSNARGYASGYGPSSLSFR